MRTYTGAETVKGGYYLHLDGWKLEAVDGACGTLSGDAGARYVRVPLPGLLIAAPLLGLAFVVVMPFFGLAVLGEGAWRKLRAAVVARRALRARTTTVRR